MDTRITFSKKWDFHRPLIEWLYVSKGKELSKIKKLMRDAHNFDAECV